MKKLIKNLVPALSLAAVTAFAWPNRVLAQTVINLKPGGEYVNIEKLTFTDLVSGAIRLLMLVAALVFFFMLVIGGIQWILSGGDKAASENARKRITSALVGLAIVFVAWAIVTLINTLFGVDIFKLNIPTFTNPPVGK